ncbi:DUF559 domain-containing protein [Paenibacillus sp. GCM10027628]|uniref:DUF559 domain-containing protein n=1 Tax=Paenibacillus sp. GCM10027628 TaxID=3273413 RepID=UPI0036291FEA
MDQTFDKAYEVYLQQHLAIRKGERLRRLREGHGHAEKLFLQLVWWKAFGDFKHLHPEYEVRDFRDGTRFIDFAFIRHSLRLAIEIDGYGTHSAQISRTQFSDQWIRQNHLIIDGWKVLRFAYDDVKDRPRMCEQMLQQFMGRYFGERSETTSKMDYIEKEVFRFALGLDRSLSPRDVSELLHVKNEKARQILRSMTVKQLLEPAGEGQQRIRYYRIAPSALKMWDKTH